PSLVGAGFAASGGGFGRRLFLRCRRGWRLRLRRFRRSGRGGAYLRRRGCRPRPTAGTVQFIQQGFELVISDEILISGHRRGRDARDGSRLTAGPLAGAVQLVQQGFELVIGDLVAVGMTLSSGGRFT